MTLNEAFGRPVRGERVEGGRFVGQAPELEFLQALDDLLNTQDVEAVRWEQYTPYFNDGEPCVFSARRTQLRVSWLTEGDDSDDYGDGYLRLDNGLEGSWDTGTRAYTFNVNGHSTKDLAAAADDFERVLRGGAHDVFLSKTFGDHAVVTATKEGFDIEFYEHD